MQTERHRGFIAAGRGHKWYRGTNAWYHIIWRRRPKIPNSGNNENRAPFSALNILFAVDYPIVAPAWVALLRYRRSGRRWWSGRDQAELGEDVP